MSKGLLFVVGFLLVILGVGMIIKNWYLLAIVVKALAGVLIALVGLVMMFAVSFSTMTRLVIFDLDGTLVNAYPAVVESVNFTLVKLGFPKKTAYQIKRAVGFGDRQLMAQLVGENLADQALKFYRPHHRKSVQTNVSLLPGAYELLEGLKNQGIILGVATNRPSIFSKIILKGLKVDRFFDRVLCADQVKRPKPYPDMLLSICREFKIKKQDALFVGDMIIDLNCGARAGIKTVGVATGSNTKKELKECKPYKIINNLNQIKKFV